MVLIGLIGVVAIGAVAWWMPFTVPFFTTGDALILSTGLVVLTVLSTLPCLSALAKDPRDMFTPLSLVGLSYLLYGVIGNVMSIVDPSPLLAGEQSLKYFPIAVLYLILSYLAFAAGCVFPWRRAPVARVPTWDGHRIVTVVVILLVLSWGIRLYAMSQGLVITKLISESARDFIGNPLLLALFLRSHSVAWLAIAICVVASVRPLGSSTEARIRWRWRGAAIVLTIGEFFYFALIQLTRAQILGVLLTALCVLFLVGKRPPLKAITVGVCIFVFGVMPFVQTLKSVQTLELSPGTGDFEHWERLVTRALPIAVELTLTDYPTAVSMTMGHSTHLSSGDFLAAVVQKRWDEDVAVPGPEGLLMQIFNLVPRAVWADKPVFETTQFLQAHYGYGWFGLGYYTDIVMTPFTEAYAFVGLPGALFLMFVLGVFFQAVYMTLVGRTGGRWNTGVVIYAVLAFDMLFNQFTIAGMLAPLRDMILMLGFLTVVLERRLPTARGRRPLPTKPQPAVDVFSESRGHR